MSELGAGAKAILRSGRGGDEPSPEDRARLRRAVFAAIAAGAATTAGETAAEAAATTKAATAIKASMGASFGGLLFKGIAGLLVAGAIGVGVASKVAPPSTPPLAKTVESFAAITAPVRATAPLPKTIAEEAKPQEDPAHSSKDSSEQAALLAKAAPPTEKSEKPETTKPAEQADTLLAETQRLREVHGALQGGDPQKALSLLDERADAEGEQLREERDAARVLALCSLGRVEEANAEAARFLEKNPRSPLAGRVRKACPPAEKQKVDP